MPPTLHRYPDRQALNRATADLLISTAQTSGERPRGIMLSGGSTPLAIFEDVVTRRPAPAADSTWFLYTDDRLVPTTSPDSNLGNSQPMLEALAVPAKRVIFVHGLLEAAPAARKYQRDLEAFFDAGGSVELGLLGLGADGHTCSIFTEEMAALRDRLAFPVYNRAGFDRISVSGAVLDRTQRLIFLVTGESKAEILAKFLAEPLSTPAGLAVKHHSHVEIWTDLPAGEL